MKDFAEPYYVQENFWGITSKELAEVTGETLERVNWVIEKMRREKGATEVDVLKIEGPAKSPAEGVYALSPDGVVGAAFYLGSDRSLAFARCMSYAEDRFELYRRVVNFGVDRNLPAEQKLELLRAYTEFLNKETGAIPFLKPDWELATFQGREGSSRTNFGLGGVKPLPKLARAKATAFCEFLIAVGSSIGKTTMRKE